MGVPCKKKSLLMQCFLLMATYFTIHEKCTFGNNKRNAFSTNRITEGLEDILSIRAVDCQRQAIWHVMATQHPPGTTLSAAAFACDLRGVVLRVSGWVLGLCCCRLSKPSEFEQKSLIKFNKK